MFIVTMAVANFELASFQTNPMIGPEPGDLNDSGGQTTYLITCKVCFMAPIAGSLFQ
jgi:hypothetical protein